MQTTDNVSMPTASPISSIEGPIPIAPGITIISGESGSQNGTPPGKSWLLQKHLTTRAKFFTPLYVSPGDLHSTTIKYTIAEAEKRGAFLLIAHEAAQPDALSFRRLRQSAMQGPFQFILVITAPHTLTIEHYDHWDAPLKWQWTADAKFKNAVLERQGPTEVPQ